LDSILRLCHAMEISPGTLMDLAFLSSDDDTEILKKQILRLLDGQDARLLKKILAAVRGFLGTVGEGA
jgi:hypothetical protein